MVVEVIMPKLGDTMEKGKIVKWLKREGEQVERGEPLLIIETDKATLEVESRSSGILRRTMAQEGEVVPVTKVIGYIAEEGETIPEEAKPEAAAPEAPPRVEVSAVRKPEVEISIKASPLARKIAREKGVDLTQVTGTGPGGRITEDDVLHYLASRAAVAPPPPPTMPSEEFQVVPMSSMRKAIAKRMVYSKTNIPHFYVGIEVDMTESMKLRENLMPTIEAKTGVRVSPTHLLVKAVAMALKEHPQINATYDGENIKIFKDINIGIAVGLEDGLIVPVLRNADKMGFIQIVTEINRLVNNAREKKLREDEFVGGTFTISNLGTFDVDSFIAIINPPETAILAVGKIKDKPVVIDNKIEVRKMVTLTLSADHRIIDGIIAAKFLQRVKSLLEAPYNLLLPSS